MGVHGGGFWGFEFFEGLGQLFGFKSEDDGRMKEE